MRIRSFHKGSCLLDRKHPPNAPVAATLNRCNHTESVKNPVVENTINRYNKEKYINYGICVTIIKAGEIIDII